MEKATKICKICGKEYPYCKTFRDEGIYRWQDVACCQEHGAEYFAQVIAARSGMAAEKEQHNDIAAEEDERTKDLFDYDIDDDDEEEEEDDEYDEDEFDDDDDD